MHLLYMSPSIYILTSLFFIEGMTLGEGKILHHWQSDLVKDNPVLKPASNINTIEFSDQLSTLIPHTCMRCLIRNQPLLLQYKSYLMR